MSTIADVIAIVESSNNQKAIRFEPLTYNNNVNKVNNIITIIQNANKCSLGTARMIYCSSFGKYQIMGFNLYNPASCALGINIVDYLNSSSLQDSTFYSFLKSAHLDPNIYTPQAMANNPNLQVQFGNVYNGNGTAYAVGIKNALHQLGYN